MNELLSITIETGQLRKVRELVALAATYAAMEGDRDEERMLLRLQRHLRDSSSLGCRTSFQHAGVTTVMPPVLTVVEGRA